MGIFPAVPLQYRVADLPQLPFEQRASLYSQLAALETAGLPTDRAFGVLKMDGVAGQRVAAARKWLARGKNPADAGTASGLFNTLDGTLIRAAVLAGSPARTYKRLADFYTARAAQAAAIRSRMWMPACVLGVSLLTAPLPAFVAGTLGIGGYVWKIAWPLLMLGGAYWVVKSLPDWSRGTEWEGRLQQWQMNLPFWGNNQIRTNARDFFESLALMLEAGISMFDALPMALATVTNPLIRAEYERILPAMQAGASLSQAIAPLQYLGDARVVAFALSGEESGTLAEMLFRHTAMETTAINDYYEQLAIWLPRVAYGLAAAWAIHGILTGPGMVPRVPEDL